MKRTMMLVSVLFALCACSRVVPQAEPESSTDLPGPVESEGFSYELLKAERLDRSETYTPSGYLVHVRYRVSRTDGDRAWFSTQYAQFRTDAGTYEHVEEAEAEGGQLVSVLLFQNASQEVDVYFDVPTDDSSAGQVSIEPDKDALAVKFDIDIE